MENRCARDGVCGQVGCNMGGGEGRRGREVAECRCGMDARRFCSLGKIEWRWRRDWPRGWRGATRECRRTRRMTEAKQEHLGDWRLVPELVRLFVHVDSPDLQQRGEPRQLGEPVSQHAARRHGYTCAEAALTRVKVP
eukprot:6206502-Pleurochrysis_carterae.AAC.3